MSAIEEDQTRVARASDAARDGIACGYPDTNDAARLGSDPVHKLLVGRIRSRGETWPRSRPSRALKIAPIANSPRTSPSSTALGPAYHDRSGSDRRSHPWGPTAELLQTSLRHLLLSPGGGFSSSTRSRNRFHGVAGERLRLVGLGTIEVADATGFRIPEALNLLLKTFSGTSGCHELKHQNHTTASRTLFSNRALVPIRLF
jgi:hypothetical protein